MRTRSLKVLAVMALLLLAACPGTTPIKKLLDDPSRFDGKSVRIAGQVKESIGALGIGIYQVDDGVRAVADYRFVWKDKIFNVGVSVGLVEVSRESGSIEDLIGPADSACYVAKKQGGHVHVYSARDEAAARQRGEIHWLQLLQSALKNGGFELHAQPIVVVDNQQTSGPGLECCCG